LKDNLEKIKDDVKVKVLLELKLDPERAPPVKAADVDVTDKEQEGATGE